MSKKKRKSKSGKKIRVEFRKNRQKRRRENDLTKDTRADIDQVADLESDERLSGKGSLSRYRTVVVEDDETDARGLRSFDEERCLKGRVLKSIGANNVHVELEDGSSRTCTVRRVVRTLARDGRNAVVAGDQVLITPVDDAEGVIERVQPRRTALSRISRGEAHVIVANIDQAVIVASIDEPELKPGLIDRFLCSTEKGRIEGIICFNKIDLGDRVKLQHLAGQYARSGYRTVLTNALTGDGIEELTRLLRHKETVFTGQSGVGKSSLLNAIQPGLARETGGISTDTNKGKHTTRVTELIPLLDGGGWVIDTPGIRQLELWDVEKEEVEGLFIEFRPFVARCRYPDCSHTHEENCGVKSAVEHQLISALRYESYCRIVSGENKHTRHGTSPVDDEPFNAAN